MSLLRDRDLWWKFEELVRSLLVASLKRVPSDEPSRRAFLASLYDPDDSVRAERVSEEFRASRIEMLGENCSIRSIDNCDVISEKIGRDYSIHQQCVPLCDPGEVRSRRLRRTCTA
jgi:hypothetical protein